MSDCSCARRRKSPVIGLIAQCEWAEPPSEVVALERGDVHVWYIRLEIDEEWFGELERTLSPPERLRARSFRFEAQRRRFVARRGLLRRLLGEYLACSPSQLKIISGPHGKPRVEAAPRVAELEFNTSSSGDGAVFAIARGLAVGIDIEQLRTIPEADDIVGRVFEVGERAVLADLKGSERDRAFLRLWTRAEARAKVFGDGLGLYDNLHLSGDKLSLRDLTPGPEYVAALAVERDHANLSCFRGPVQQ